MMPVESDQGWAPRLPRFPNITRANRIMAAKAYVAASVVTGKPVPADIRQLADEEP